MKKFIAVAMIALLAVTTVFAAPALSGSAEVAGKLDLTKDKVGAGFVNGSGAKAVFTFEGATAEKKSEADIYAEIAGEVALKAVEAKTPGVVEMEIGKLAVTKANIGGANWVVSILGPAGTATFAQDWWDYSGDGDFRDEALKAGKASNGVTATVYDYTIGVGGWVGQDKKEASLSVKTPAYALMDGMTLQAAAGANYAEGKLTSAAGVNYAFALDALKLGVRGDFAWELDRNADKNTFAGDVALDVTYAPATLNFYYGSTNNYYSINAEVALKDLTGLDITAGVGVIDIQKNKGLILADVAYKGVVNASADVNYALDGTEKWGLNLAADYTFENVGKLAAGLNFGGDKAKAFNTVKTNVSFENTTLIEGATLKAAYATGNLLDEAAADRFGALTASIKLTF